MRVLLSGALPMLLLLAVVDGACAGQSTPLNPVEYDADDYGCIGDDATDDTACLQAVIDAAIAGGGGVVRFARHYTLSSALTLDAKSPGVSIWIRGDGARTSQIRQATAGADILVVGRTSCECADNVKVSDLTLKAGRYALRLNNALHGLFQNLDITGGSTVGIYMEGQNERHVFQNIEISGSTRNGILVGQSNGACAGPLDNPELQKAVFEDIRIAGTTEGPTFRITAGLCNGTQQVSGDISIRHLLLEGNKQGGLYIAHAGLGVTVSRVTTEDQPDRDATYSAIQTDATPSIVYITDSHLANNPSHVNRYKYFINHTSGQAFIQGVSTGVSPATSADIRFADSGSILGSTLVGGVASGLLIDGDGPIGRVMASDLRDSRGRIILGGRTDTPMVCDAQNVGLSYYDADRRALCYCDNGAGSYRWCPVTDMKRCRGGSAADCGTPRSRSRPSS